MALKHSLRDRNTGDTYLMTLIYGHYHRILIYKQVTERVQDKASALRALHQRDFKESFSTGRWHFAR